MKALALAVFLTACAASPAQNLLTACDSYADTLDALAVRNRLGLLSGETQDEVDRIDAVVGPICDGSVPRSDPDAALAIVEEALVALIEVKNDE